MDKVSEYIKQQRKARNITIEEMSKGTLISIVTLKDIESGRFDKYKGDELYIKMYLKKIAKFLELDANEVSQLVDGYTALTQEIHLHDMQEKEEQMRVAEENKKNTKVVDRLGDTIREVKSTSSIKRRKRKHVYEDNFLKRYIKYGIVIILCMAIIFVVWYAIVASRADSGANYVIPDTPSVEENADAGDSLQNQDEETEDTEDEDDTEDEPVSITHVQASTYNVHLGVGDPFRLEVTFGSQSLFSLFLGGEMIPNTNRVYEAGETFVHEVELTGNERMYTLNIWNLDDVVIRINGTELEYNSEEVRFRENAFTFTLYMEGE